MKKLLQSPKFWIVAISVLLLSYILLDYFWLNWLFGKTKNTTTPSTPAAKTPATDPDNWWKTDYSNPLDAIFMEPYREEWLINYEGIDKDVLDAQNQYVQIFSQSGDFFSAYTPSTYPGNRFDDIAGFDAYVNSFRKALLMLYPEKSADLQPYITSPATPPAPTAPAPPQSTQIKSDVQIIFDALPSTIPQESKAEIAETIIMDLNNKAFQEVGAQIDFDQFIQSPASFSANNFKAK